MVGGTVIRVGDLEIDLTSRLIRKAGVAVSLSRQQRALLEFLVRNVNQTLTHQQLLQEIWGDSYDDDSRYILHNAIKRLREKVGDSYIVAESNIGYRFTTEAHAAPDPTAAPTAANPPSTPALYVPSPSFTNLPSQRTSFVGRGDEKQTIRSLLMQPEIRLVTLTGPGGTGKTRLALEVASSLADTFINGTVFIPLAAVTEPPMVLRAIGQALSIKEKVGDQPVETIINTIRDKHLLIILDNFEQVVAAAPYISELLEGCPSIKVLVTSRAVLQIYGEHEYLVPPLALPDQHDSYPPDALATFSAIALFVERARAGNRLFQLTNENAEAVTSICTRLDGLPLAIELVTARVKYQSPQALWDRLQTNTALSLLTGGPRDLGTRQQTLRAAIAWSYDLLAPEERQLFNRLAVFEDGYRVEAIERVCDIAGDLLLHPFDGMVVLMDKSLVHFQQDVEGTTHFAMLQTIREYAQEQLTACGERELLTQRHAEYYLMLVNQPDEVGVGSAEIAWLNFLEQEHGNIRQALRWFIQSMNGEAALTMCSKLWRFWYTRGYFREGLQWLDAGFKINGSTADQTIAKALHAEGMLSMAQGRYDIAIDRLEKALSIWKVQGNKSELANVLNSLGTLAMGQHKYDVATSLFQEALTLFRDSDNKRGVAGTTHNLGIIAFENKDYKTAQRYLQEALYTEREINFILGVVTSLIALGSIAYWEQRYSEAIDYYKESLRVNQQFNDQDCFVICMESLGFVAYDKGEFEIAAILFSAAANLREAVGLTVPETEFHTIQKQKIQRAEEQFGEQWHSWWVEGKHMRIDAVIEYINMAL
jgi:predicted ATPase/DNA-binding winged helix-turn-helix (wHTH) protein